VNRVAFALLAALVACAPPERKAPVAEKPQAVKPAIPPTRDEAKTIVADSPDFGEYDFTNAAYTLPMSRAAMNEPARAAAADLKRAGWISFSGDSVVLSAKAKGDKRWLVRPNGFVDIVPLAKKEFLSVDGVRNDSEGNVAVDFTWKWIPNEIGSAFRSGAVHDRFAAPHQATATLIRSGDSWTILRIRPR
jgi:hypothetical protein